MTENKFVLSIFALLVLFIIYIYARNKGAEKYSQRRILVHLLYACMAIIVLDMLDWLLNGVPGVAALRLHYTVVTLNFILSFLPPFYWVLYSRHETDGSIASIKKIRRTMLILYAVLVLFMLINLHTQWIFGMDGLNRYYRGPYIAYIYILFLIPLLINIIYLAVNRKHVAKQRLIKLFLTVLPPLIANIIQFFYFGLSLAATSLSFSVLILYLGIQQRASSTDYLTGLYNRRQLDEHIASRIKNSYCGKTFAAMLIDMNNFKQINDTLGHNAGDAAICDMARILHSNTKTNDFIARHGGDEFFIILDISDYTQLEAVVRRIRKSTREFNARSERPYQLNFAIGYDIYRPASKMNARQFFAHIDSLMYREKERMQQN